MSLLPNGKRTFSRATQGTANIMHSPPLRVGNKISVLEYSGSYIFGQCTVYIVQFLSRETS